MHTHTHAHSFEGGFGAEPFNEAHGGYAFCAVAGLAILGKCDVADMDAVLRWVTLRQMADEGGFQGRTNKLVDACYSFWQGSIPAILMIGTEGRLKAAGNAGGGGSSGSGGGGGGAEGGPLIMDQMALQTYILKCCQQLKGGLRDKPGKGRDHYHTCYALSGLSIAQSFGLDCVLGPPENRLRATSPIYNVRGDKLAKAQAYYASLECSHEELMQPGAPAPAREGAVVGGAAKTEVAL